MSIRGHYDVIVIGAGPSGMMAAGRAAERGRSVLLLEKNGVVGKKLSITGGGRCNILNAEPDTRALIANFGDASKFLHSPFSQHGMQDSWNFFEKRGLPLVVEARKRAFPKSQNARDVTAFMKRYMIENRVEIKVKIKVTNLKVVSGDITGVVTKDGIYTADSYVLATGGSARTETGSTGEGIEWLADLGYTIHAPNPNIVPLTVHEDWVKRLSGTTLSFMKITFHSRRKSDKSFSRTGKILFTHFGLSGPLILNAAHEVKKMLTYGPVTATIDLYPDTDTGTLRNRVLETFNINKNKMLKNVIGEFVPAGMQNAVLAQFPRELAEIKVHSIQKEVRHRLVDSIKRMPLTVTGTMGMDWAVISDGGVDLTEVDTRTMCSKLHDNLYFAGDVLNINRPSGGYSLQLCWTTGWVIGENV